MVLKKLQGDILAESSACTQQEMESQPYTKQSTCGLDIISKCHYSSDNVHTILMVSTIFVRENSSFSGIEDEYNFVKLEVILCLKKSKVMSSMCKTACK